MTTTPGTEVARARAHARATGGPDPTASAIPLTYTADQFGLTMFSEVPDGLVVGEVVPLNFTDDTGERARRAGRVTSAAITADGRRLHITVEVLPPMPKRPKAAPPVRSFLDVSLEHVPADLRVTGFGDVEGVQVENVEGGWWVYVPSEEAMPDDLPGWLDLAFYVAHGYGCQYILFDRDAATCDELVRFDQ